MFEIRRYSRIWCAENALVGIDDIFETEVQLLNISLNGAFFKLKQDCVFRKGDHWQLSYTPPDSDIILHFKIEVVHFDDNYVGVKFVNADRDTMNHLRRFLEAKVENPQQLEEEFSFLILNAGNRESVISQSLDHLYSR